MLSPNSGTVEQLAREPASMHPDVIRTTGPDIRVMREAAGVTPIVGSLIGEDPIKADFAASLAHPGGTIIGMVRLAPGELPIEEPTH